MCSHRPTVYLLIRENLSRVYVNYRQQWGQFEEREFVALFSEFDSHAAVGHQFFSLNEASVTLKLYLSQQGGANLGQPCNSLSKRVTGGIQ